MKSKAIITLLLVNLIYTSVFSQICNPETEHFENQLCWIKNYIRNQYSINDNTTDKFKDVFFGTDNYYVSGNNVPWGGDYFSWTYGGLCTRLNSYSSEESFPSIESLNWDKIKEMTKEEIARLSPAEKMDIYLNNKDFKITKRELTARGPLTPDIQSWEGFCNGVRAAGALTKEPIKNITVKNADNLEIEFTAADLKILAGASYFYLTPNGYGRVGSNNSIKPNPGAFDLILRLILAENKKVFFFDDNSSNEIWNHSALGFERKVLEKKRKVKGSDNPPSNSTHIITFTTTFYHMGEISTHIMNGATKPRIESKNSCCVEENNYVYTLFLDKKDNIIDGFWLHNFYPDNIWFANGKGDDSNHSSGIDNNTGKEYRGNANIPFDVLISLIEKSSQN
ncbi:hypothetical protein [Aquimarina sp. AU58]|uniref:hypothetical protein n=1 Tax=Aquimarina sp. AU58 TaxID=1874112 RepID=UPI000D64CEAD|nr:hypothetical protein [Aquimarina sp. AU58]